jgi:lysophospholipase L1-like esterase
MRTLSFIFLLALCSCASGPHGRALKQQVGESVVFIGEQPSALAFGPIATKSVRVRNQYLPGTNVIEYIEGRDFVVDYAAGSLRRTPQSRLPDFRTNVLFGKEDFDHSRFPGYGNLHFFAFVDYEYLNTNHWPVQPAQGQFLKGIQAKLRAGGRVKVVAFGDSITAGGEASRPDLIFWRRWADGLQRKYPRARIMAVNGSTPGDTTANGLQRLRSKVLDEKPDLVLIAFGMNDNNVAGVPVPQFEVNLKQMIGSIRKETGAEIILLSAFPPNPKWKFGSPHMADYAKATERVAHEMDCAFADVFNNWQALAQRKKPEDLLGNNINHPNDFGHWIYFQVLDRASDF